MLAPFFQLRLMTAEALVRYCYQLSVEPSLRGPGFISRSEQDSLSFKVKGQRNTPDPIACIET